MRTPSTTIIIYLDVSHPVAPQTAIRTTWIAVTPPKARKIPCPLAVSKSSTYRSTTTPTQPPTSTSLHNTRTPTHRGVTMTTYFANWRCTESDGPLCKIISVQHHIASVRSFGPTLQRKAG